MSRSIFLRNKEKQSNHYNISRRYLFFIAVVIAIFIYLVYGLYNLQLRSGAEYEKKAEDRRITKITLRGNRGMITDADAVILANSESIYNVTFYRDTSQNKDSDYQAFTSAIQQSIGIIEKNGSELSVSFVIRRNEDTNEWEFHFGSGVNESVLQTRETQWRNNNYFSVLNFPDAKSAIEELKKRYFIPDDMDEETMLKVMAVYSEMQMNLFNSQPIVIAKDVPYDTVIEIEARSITLPGMEISVGSKRLYPRGTLASQVIGYLGAIPSATKWSELKEKGYKYSDTIGVDGIEASMEDWLTQNSDLRQGYRKVERNHVNKITREMEYAEPEDGNNVKLTIVASYQQQAERTLAANVLATRELQEKKLMEPNWLEANKAEITTNRNWTKFPLSLADRAAMMVVDMEGRVLAMANYPTFDLNIMAAGGTDSRALLTDERNVLMNYNIHAVGPPGSIFKMVPALGALMEKELYPNETISDGGRYTVHTTDQSTAPKCWISESNRYKHQHLTVVGGLSNSCNYFFYTLGTKLGSTRLYQYSSEFGLTSKTGVELPGEVRSIVGCQTSLYNPDKAMDESSQDTAMPIIIFNAIKKHLRNEGASRNITYDDERLDRCVKKLMDMAVNNDQGPGGEIWLSLMRPILMTELNMDRSMVYTQSVIGDTYGWLNDIKWGEAQNIQVAIGQSITLVTPAAVSRYVAALGNGGKVYNLSIVDSVTSPEGDIISQTTPSIMHSFEDENLDQYLGLILEGMEGVVDESGTAESYFRKWEYRKDVCAKTGTAEVTTVDLENNAWFVMLAPREKPEIAVVVFIPSGFSGGYASMAARDFVGWYMDQKTLRTGETVLPGGNQLAP